MNIGMEGLKDQAWLLVFGTCQRHRCWERDAQCTCTVPAIAEGGGHCDLDQAPQIRMTRLLGRYVGNCSGAFEVKCNPPTQNVLPLIMITASQIGVAGGLTRKAR